MQDRLLDIMQIAATGNRCGSEAGDRLRADHEPRGGDAAGPSDADVARVARPVHEIPVSDPPSLVACAASGGCGTGEAALPPRIHTERDIAA